MKKTLLTACLFGLSSLAYADIVEGTGVGETAELAKKNAMDNAVKSHVGQFLLTKEDMNNDQLNQKIIDYSSVYLKDVKTLSEEQKDGQFEVKVSVDLDSSKLVEKFKQQNPQLESKVTDSDVKVEEPKEKEVKAEEVKKEESKPQEPKAIEQNTALTLEQQFQKVIIDPIKNKTFVAIETVSEPVEVKRENGDMMDLRQDEVLYERKLKLTLNKEYRKAVTKFLISLNEPQGINLVVNRLDLNKSYNDSVNIYSGLINQEKFEKLKTLFNKIPRVPIFLKAEDPDGIPLFNAHCKYDSSYDTECRIKQGEEDNYLMEKFSIGLITPYINKNGIFIVPNGSFELRIRYKLNQDDIKELQETNGKLIFKLGR